MAPRAGTAAVVLIAVLFCLLVSPAPARRPVDLPPHDVVENKAFVEHLLPKLLEGAAVPEDEELARTHAHAHGGLVFPCGGDAATVISSGEAPLPLHGEARPSSPKVEEEEGKHARPYDSYASDTECDTDSDASDNECDTDSDDDDEGGIVGWFWRLADRLI